MNLVPEDADLKIAPADFELAVKRRAYRKNCPTDRAVVATDSTGHLVSVLEYIGRGLD